MQSNEEQKRETERLPLLPLRGLLAYPNMLLHLDVGRDKSILALEHAMENDKQLVVVAQRDAQKDNPHQEDMYGVGTVVMIKHMTRRPDNTVSVLVEGKSRAFLLCVLETGEMQMAEVERFEPLPLSSTPEYRAYMNTLKDAFKKYAKARGGVAPELRQSIEADDDADTLTDMIAANVVRDIRRKQQILETRDVIKRMKSLTEMVLWESEYIAVERKIMEQTHISMEKHQKEYFLREQMRAIRVELGEDEPESDGFMEKLEALPMNKEAHDRVKREIEKYSNLPPHSPESSVSRSYIEYMLELPWGVIKGGKIDVKKARRVLEAQHYGLSKVKQRILEFLAVKSLNGGLDGTILCLVGPPGVGKTSIAKSVASAMDREFTRLSLGGLRDEAEIRGHRRTYIGAMPGRIISSVKQCGATNPVFLLDEIDKMTSDMRGDPASAMLEVLDPEQNSTFRDNYLEAPFDLSSVFFITTANTVDSIPRPLLDRMELIEVPSYTLEEKVQIAKRHLWPKQLKKNGLSRTEVKISEKAFGAIIDGYTREAGVRNLEREIGTVLRKTAVKWLETDAAERTQISIGPKQIPEYLGATRFGRMQTLKSPEIGVINGLAWTSVGGETLQIEAATMPGSGAVDLTGKLGDVMKESARAAHSYIRSNAERLGVPVDFYKNIDLHIHVPEGATPKDGPSAGVAITCAMVSAISERLARQDIAMTGEVTLRGRVLPIGGVKEKLLAAYRMGIETVLIPEENQKDLEELPGDVREKLSIYPIKTVDQAIERVLLGVGAQA